MHTIMVMFIIGQFELYAEKKGCAGKVTRKGLVATKRECGIQCTDVSTIFTYGRSDGIACNSNGCYCICLMGRSDGTCDLFPIPTFNLYRFIKKGKTL